MGLEGGQHQTVEAKSPCGCSGGEDCGCESCRAKAKASGAWVYALGNVSPRFPSLAVEKEVTQAIGRSETNGLTNHQAFHAALSRPENRYLVRQLCWVFSIDRVETYLVTPRDPGDYALLLGALRSNPTPGDMDLAIGMRGPVAPPAACNGLSLHVLVFDQLYSFDRDSLLRSIPPPETPPAKEFGAAAAELLDRVLQITGNTGVSDEHRALNYLAVRYPAIYTKAAEEFAKNAALTSVSVRPSPLSAARKLVNVVFAYTHRSTDVTEQFAVRVDVTEEFPFLASKLSPYYDR